MTPEQEKQFIEIVQSLSEVRVYNSCGVFKGVMIRDNEKTYELIKKARKLVEDIKNGR